MEPYHAVRTGQTFRFLLFATETSPLVGVWTAEVDCEVRAVKPHRPPAPPYRRSGHPGPQGGVRSTVGMPALPAHSLQLWMLRSAKWKGWCIRGVEWKPKETDVRMIGLHGTGDCAQWPWAMDRETLVPVLRASPALPGTTVLTQNPAGGHGAVPHSCSSSRLKMRKMVQKEIFASLEE